MRQEPEEIWRRKPTYEEEYEDMKESAEAVEYYKHKGEETKINLFFEKIENME